MSAPATAGRIRLVLGVVVFALSFLAFAPALDGEFVLWDDEIFLVQNTHYRGLGGEHLAWMLTDTSFGAYQPLAWLSYAIDHAVWGLDPRGFHLTSVAIHALSAVALFVAAGMLLPMAVPKLAERPRAAVACAAFAALIWALHPQRVEPVAWANQRRDVLTALLLFASLAVWLRHAAREGSLAGWWKSRAYWASLLLFSACLLAKAAAMGWFVVLFVLDVWPLRRGPVRASLLEKIPFVLVTLPIAAVAWIGQSAVGAVGGPEAVPWLDRFVLAGHSAAFYVAKAIAPTGLRAIYLRTSDLEGLTTTVVLGAVATLVVTVWVFARRRSSPGIAVAWAAYLVLLAPVSGFFPIGWQSGADRFAHLPAAALALLVVGVVAGRTIGRGALLSGVIAVAALGTSAWTLTPTWRTSESLFRRVVDVDPGNWLARGQLANVYQRQGRIEDAQRQFELALDAHPLHVDTLLGLASVYGQAGRPEDAQALLERIFATEPGHPRAWNNLGQIRGMLGDDIAAERAFLRAIEEDPDYETPAMNLGILYSRRGDVERAEQFLRRAIALRPGSVEAREILGVVLLDADRLEEAESAFRAALAIRQDTFRSNFFLGVVLGHQGKWQDAVTPLEAAHRLRPGDPGVGIQLAETFVQLGRKEDARGLARQVLEDARAAGDADAYQRAQALLRK